MSSQTAYDQEIQTVTRCIITQLGGQGRLTAMIGAKQFVVGGDREGKIFVQFGYAGAGTRNKANKCAVLYDAANDLYIVEFWSIRGTSFIRKSRHEGIHAEKLIDLFEEQTGLYLTLSPRKQ
jgi:hypothetical protein